MCAFSRFLSAEYSPVPMNTFFSTITAQPDNLPIPFFHPRDLVSDHGL